MRSHRLDVVPTPAGHRFHPDNLPRLGLPAPVSGPLVSAVRATGLLDAIWDQGQEGSCLPHALARALNFTLRKHGLPAFNPRPAPAFIYWNGRPNDAVDSGSTVGDLLTGADKFKVCGENDCPYIPGQFNLAPSAAAFTAALAELPQSIIPVALPDLAAMKQCLVGGYPFVVGMSVFPDFESVFTAQDGIVTLPGDALPIGGHGIVISDCDDLYSFPPALGYEPGGFWFDNSYGQRWGIAGRGVIPYEYARQFFFNATQIQLSL